MENDNKDESEMILKKSQLSFILYFS